MKVGDLVEVDLDDAFYAIVTGLDALGQPVLFFGNGDRTIWLADPPRHVLLPGSKAIANFSEIMKRKYTKRRS